MSGALLSSVSGGLAVGMSRDLLAGRFVNRTSWAPVHLSSCSDSFAVDSCPADLRTTW